jgi:hypothetical protein
MRLSAAKAGSAASSRTSSIRDRSILFMFSPLNYIKSKATASRAKPPRRQERLDAFLAEPQNLEKRELIASQFDQSHILLLFTLRLCVFARNGY